MELLARRIAERLKIPVIGSDAFPACDGQILVTDDMLGLFADFTPRFVRRYVDLGPTISAAVRGYAADVRARRFPGPEHCFSAKPTAGKPGGQNSPSWVRSAL